MYRTLPNRTTGTEPAAAASTVCSEIAAERRRRVRAASVGATRRLLVAALVATVTADGNSFDTGDTGAGRRATFGAPAKPGRYTFHCSLHHQREGAIVVAGQPGGSSSP